MYILVRQVFKGDNYSREETINYLGFFSETTIQGRQLFKGAEETIRGNTVCLLLSKVHFTDLLKDSNT